MVVAFSVAEYRLFKFTAFRHTYSVSVLEENFIMSNTLAYNASLNFEQRKIWKVCRLPLKKKWSHNHPRKNYSIFLKKRFLTVEDHIFPIYLAIFYLLPPTLSERIDVYNSIFRFTPQKSNFTANDHAALNFRLCSICISESTEFRNL